MFYGMMKPEIIAGAYRMGLGSKIYEQHGIEGFYLHELFRFEPELYSMMSQSIEMGRAFIISEYQQNQCLFSYCEGHSSYYFKISRTQVLNWRCKY